MWNQRISSLPKLFDFIEYYAGPRRKRYGYTESELLDWQLPLPLKHLYQFAGKWPHPKRKDALLLESQDTLIPPHEMLRESGIISFIKENQSCWFLGTEERGRNPTVYYSGDIETPSWVNTHSNLIDNVHTFVLLELLWGSKWLEYSENLQIGNDLVDILRERSSTWRVLIENSPYHNYSNSFYLCNDCILILDQVCDGDNYQSAGVISQKGSKLLHAVNDEFGFGDSLRPYS